MRSFDVQVQLDPALRHFLRSGRSSGAAGVAGAAGAGSAGGALVVPVTGGDVPSLGHVVQSLGVPLTEVELEFGGQPVAPGERAAGPGELKVLARRRPQAAPTSPPRFVLDVHLGALARRMRLLGLDVAYTNDADDPELVEVSLAQQRVLLTRDRGLLMRRRLRWGAYVRGQRTADQLADVLDRFAPPLDPWARCTVCNGLLEACQAADVRDQLQPGTLRTFTEFARCTQCGRAFWRGAHAERLHEVVTAAVGPAGGS